MGAVAKRSSMTFYSDGNDHYSHRVRIVLVEKGVAVEIHDIDPDNKPEDIATLNPYNSLPTLLDRELVLYESNVMMEYLDERFPHPPLLPVYPVERAEIRLLKHRIQKDWCTHADIILSPLTKEKAKDEARKKLKSALISVAPIFKDKPYFMSEGFTVVDCCTAPILWRLKKMGIEITEKQAKPLFQYMERLFERESFQASLSEHEHEMNL
jgi:RNA polymerase-associated protein